MKLQTKINLSVGALISIAGISTSTLAALTSLEQGLAVARDNLEIIATQVEQSEDPISSALFEGSSRELTALYRDEFGVEAYLQENAGLVGEAIQITREIDLGSGGTITLAVSTESIYQGAAASIIPLAIVTTLIVVLATLVTHLILKPDIRAIHQLILQAQLIARGGNREISAKHGSWELETLNDSLGSMIRSLNSSEKALEKFLSDASHELKTPLTVIRGYLEMIATANRDTELGLRAERALVQALRMQGIIDDLLKLAELRSEGLRHVAPLNLGILTGESIEELKDLMGEFELELRLDLRAEFVGQDAQIRTLLRNLLVNLNHHVPFQSKVRIETAVDGDNAKLTIEDSGFGFPSEILGSGDSPVRFRRGSESKPGSTGLGLAIVFEIISAHAGKIRLGKSELGGAKTEIWLPLPDPHKLEN